MNISNPPASYQEAEQPARFLRARPHDSQRGRRSFLMGKKATQAIVVRKLPARMKRLGAQITSSLLSERSLNDALGLPRAVRGLTSLFDTYYGARNFKRRFENAPNQAWFVQGRPVSTLYPNGYQLSELGPAKR